MGLAATVLSSCLVLSAAAAPPALPWIDSGHRIIALRCWEELSPPARERLTALLAQHPRYREDLLAELPAGASAAATAAHAFAMAAVWPDTIRAPGHPMHRQHHHSVWHYVTVAYERDGVKAAKEEPKGKGPHDVLGALAKVRADLADGKLPAAERAIALCWLLHLVADLHQPLHACSLYSTQFPDGDRGGNLFWVMKDVRYENTKTNLHLLWDSLLGSYESVEADAVVAAGLAQRADLQRAALAKEIGAFSPAAWAKASHRLAKEHAYSFRGTALQGLPEREAKQQRGAPPVPAGYMAAAERLALRQAMLAAFRSADALEAIFGG